MLSRTAEREIAEHEAINAIGDRLWRRLPREARRGLKFAAFGLVDAIEMPDGAPAYAAALLGIRDVARIIIDARIFRGVSLATLRRLLTHEICHAAFPADDEAQTWARAERWSGQRWSDADEAACSAALELSKV